MGDWLRTRLWLYVLAFLMSFAVMVVGATQWCNVGACYGSGPAMITYTVLSMGLCVTMMVFYIMATCGRDRVLASVVTWTVELTLGSLFVFAFFAYSIAQVQEAQRVHVGSLILSPVFGFLTSFTYVALLVFLAMSRPFYVWRVEEGVSRYGLARSRSPTQEPQDYLKPPPPVYTVGADYAAPAFYPPPVQVSSVVPGISQGVPRTMSASTTLPF